MTIESALRCKVFSHLPGTECILPGSHLICRLFPARIELGDVHSSLAQISFSFQGILQQFTVTVDLESFAIIVSGFLGDDYFRYRLSALGDGFTLTVLKAPTHVTLDILQSQYQMEKQDSSYLFYNKTKTAVDVPFRERLSLGCNKAQDITMMLRRQDIREIVPLWFYYSQSIAVTETHSIPPSEIATQKMLQDMALVGFTGIFVPRLQDDLHYGVTHPWWHQYSSPVVALKHSFQVLRQIFFKESPGSFSFLPHLPAQFHCGRLIDVKTEGGHVISLEWTKKKMRRLMIHPARDEAIICNFPSDIESFRVKSSECTSLTRNGEQVFLKKGTPLLLDNFQK